MSTGNGINQIAIVEVLFGKSAEPVQRQPSLMPKLIMTSTSTMRGTLHEKRSDRGDLSAFAAQSYESVKVTSHRISSISG